MSVCSSGIAMLPKPSLSTAGQYCPRCGHTRVRHTDLRRSGATVDHNSDAMPDDGTDAAKVIVFGDLSVHVIAQRTQVAVRVLRERFADLDQVGFLLSERVGGALFNPEALRIGV